MDIIQQTPKIDISVHVQEDKQTIVHCNIQNPDNDLLIRIWKSTFLRDNQTNILAKLITAFNISFHPVWTQTASDHTFTLIFEGLEKSCKSFDLIEEIPQSGGFYIPNIGRNSMDVYHLTI